MTLPYPAPLAEGARDVQRHVVDRTKELTGLDVPTARVDVTALAAPKYSRTPASPTEDTNSPTTARRWWSPAELPSPC